MDTVQTVQAYTMKVNRLKRERGEIKEYMMQKFAWNGYFGKRSNKLLVSRAYTEAVSIKFTNKIQSLKKSKKRLDERQTIVRKIGSAVEEFISENIRYGTIFRDKNKQHIGRCIFCKYVFENVPKIDGRAVTGKHMRNYLSAHKTKNIRTASPAQWRQRFTQSFVKFPERKRMYHDFLHYMKMKSLSF